MLARTPMTGKTFLILLAMSANFLTGCAEYGTQAMAGNAVDIPDPTPLSQEPPVLTAPTPSPAPGTNGQQVPGR
jgi:hypothetical protein